MVPSGRIVRLSLFVLLTVFSPFAILKGAEGLLEWIHEMDGFATSEASQIVVGPQALVLSDNAYLSADQIVLQAPIITNGHLLVIETRQLLVEKEGKIIGFDKPVDPASEKDEMPATPTTEGLSRNKKYQDGTKVVKTTIVNALGEIEGYEEHEVPISIMRGEDGLSGNKGLSGDDGRDVSLDPQPVHIYTGVIKGELLIDGKGQTGGRGGKGGQGGKGGPGAQGLDAKGGKVGSWGARAARRGGNGGQGGEGGDGGNGGNGGKGLDVFIFSSLPESSYDLHINFEGGDPGEGGERGDPGEGGDAGQGGNPAGGTPFVGSDKGAGAAGNVGPPGILYGVKGKNGERGPEGSRQFFEAEDLESLRSNAMEEWIRFHLSRNFWLLASETILWVDEQVFVEEMFQGVDRRDAPRMSNASLKAILFASTENLNKLVVAWEIYKRFLEREVNEESMDRYYLSVAHSMVEFLNLIQNGEDVDETYSLIRRELQQMDRDQRNQLRNAVVRAVKNCARLTDEIKALSEGIYRSHGNIQDSDFLSVVARYRDQGASIIPRHFVIPACHEDIDVWMKDPLGATIRLRSHVAAQIIGVEGNNNIRSGALEVRENLRGSLIRRETQSWLSPIAMKSAFAESEEEFSPVRFVFREPTETEKRIEDFKSVTLQKLPDTDNHILLSSLHSIQREKISPDTLAPYLVLHYRWLKEVYGAKNVE